MLYNKNLYQVNKFWDLFNEKVVKVATKMIN